MSTSLDRSIAFLDSLTESRNDSLAIPEEDDDDVFGWARQICKLDRAPAITDQPRLSLDDARAYLRARVSEYLSEPAPTYALALAVEPGVGKTTISIESAEAAARSGRTVGFLGPRRDFFDDVIRLAERPEWWQPWDARQNASENRRKTCEYVDEISRWMNKGHKAKGFCSGVCGWDYMADRCVWHAQAHDQRPIVFGQHQHFVTGHPRDFDVVIIDESPVNIFTRHWRIASRYVMPNNMDEAEPMTEIMSRLANACERTNPLSGPDLLEALGGAARVLNACELMPLEDEALSSPFIHSTEEAESADYLHLPYVIALLSREARCALAGQRYISRIMVNKGFLNLYLRSHVNRKMPPHRIILDATANRELLETLLGQRVEVVAPQVARQGRVYQLTDRGNGVTTLLREDKTTKIKLATPKAIQARDLIQKIVADRGYREVGVVTFKDLEKVFASLYETAHFGGARGTNRFDNKDALFVVGTPMPSLSDIISIATMLYQDRMTPFVDEKGRSKFVPVNRPYAFREPDGTGWGYPVSEFADSDLNAILWQLRDAEIIQTAHRARINIRAADVWLLTNLPIDALAPDGLHTMRALMGAPDGVDSWKWPAILEMLEWHFEHGEPLVMSLFHQQISVREATASQYMKRIALAFSDQWRLRKPGERLSNDAPGRGRLPLALIPSSYQPRQNRGR